MADKKIETKTSNNIRFDSIRNAYIDSSDKPDNDTAEFGYNIPTIDIRHGGQWGVLPRIGGVENGKAIHEWMHEQAYQKRDIIPVVLQTPRMFELLPNTANWKQAIKAMVEVHAKTIEGLNSSLTVETTEHELGMSGATFKEVSNVNREATSITMTFQEKYGMPFELLLDTWIRYGLMDPDLKAPLITRVGKGVPDAWTAEWYSMTCIFIEPDPLYRKAVHAWLVPNMFPTSNPDIIGKKDKSAGRELKELSIEFGGFALPPTNRHVKKIADTILNNLRLWEKDPETLILAPATDVEPSLQSVADVDIYYEGVKKAQAKK